MEEEEAVLLLLSPEDEPPAALASALSVALPAEAVGRNALRLLEGLDGLTGGGTEQTGRIGIEIAQLNQFFLHLLDRITLIALAQGRSQEDEEEEEEEDADEEVLPEISR